jgi:multicomponent Na+:H+ antiporter subunit D
MALEALVILVPMASATFLAALSPFAGPRKGVLGLLPAVGALVLVAIVLARTGERDVVWFSGWHPRDGVAIGIDFAIDPLGGGLAVFVAVLAVVAFVLAARLIVVQDLRFEAASAARWRAR